MSLRPSSRTSIVAWLRKAHGWIGLWGATLGLLFGTSGIWLNHRAVLALALFATPCGLSATSHAEPLVGCLAVYSSCQQSSTHSETLPCMS